MKLSKDTHKKNTTLNKTRTLTKSMNMGIWLIGALNQLFVRGAQIRFSKKKKKKHKAISGKNPFFLIGPCCTSHVICPNIGF